MATQIYSVVSVSVENNTPFYLRQVTVKAQSNEALFKLIQQAIERKPVQMIVTPRVDVSGYPYYWIGVRFDRQELNFKLQVSDQIVKFIHAYLKGEKELPNVCDFNPTEKMENVGEWLTDHEMLHYGDSISFREELTMKDDVNYLTKKMNFINGKIIYPSVVCEDVLSIILD